MHDLRVAKEEHYRLSGHPRALVQTLQVLAELIGAVPEGGERLGGSEGMAAVVVVTVVAAVEGRDVSWISCSGPVLPAQCIQERLKALLPK